MSDQHALLDQSYHAIVGQLPLAGLVFDATLRVRHANAACARLFGRESMAAFDLGALKGEGILAALRAPLDGLNGAYDGPYAPAEEPPAGWIQLRTSPVRENNGKVVGGIALFVDVTERHRLEEQLRQAHRLEAVGRLAGGMAHDIAGLLGTLRDSAEHALAVLGPAEPARVDVSEVKRVAERVSGLTRQLLAFSKRQVLRFEVLDPQAVLRAMEAKIREVALRLSGSTGDG